MNGLDSYSWQVFFYYFDPISIYNSLWIDCLFEIRKIVSSGIRCRVIIGSLMSRY